MIQKFSDLTSEVYKTKTFRGTVISNFTVHFDYLHTKTLNYETFWKQENGNTSGKKKQTSFLIFYSC